MAKSKLGLQKEVSKIFTGIQIPKKNAAGQDVRSTTPVPPVMPPAQVAPPVAPAPAASPVKVIPAIIDEPLAVPVVPTTPVTPPVPAAPAVTSPVTAPVAVVPEPVVSAPVPAKTVTPKPAPVSPKPFTIPEPPAKTASQQPRQAVYEPPKPRQTNYEPPAPSSSPVSSPAKQSKPEFIQSKDSPILKIINNLKAKLLTSKHGAPSGRQKMMLMLSPVLVIVLLLVVVNAIKKAPKTSAKPSKKATAVVAASDGKITWELPQPIPANLRDPMVFGAVSTQGKETTAGPVVKGIVYSEDNPCAVVGDRIVSAGDTVAGATVVKINPDSVDFAIGDKKWTQKVEH
jgi:hypothetical protein